MPAVFQEPLLATQWCHEQRKQKRTIGYVPTMGALHRGHLSLVERSIADNDVTCVSIFVNPLQFNESTDYLRYPRDFDSDCEILGEVGCDMVFSGTNRDMFPEALSLNEVQLLDPGPAGKGLEGDWRPGHLQGVCTVVQRLFQFVGDCRAYFGLKDYQQSLIVRDLSERLGYPEIITCKTIRDDNGLALSSRNTLLNPVELELAQNISTALVLAKQLWQAGERDCEQLRTVMRNALPEPLKVDYADIRDPNNWQAESPQGTLQQAIALIAAHVGSVRLIDNLRLDQNE